jgi:hypothetical protein
MVAAFAPLCGELSGWERVVCRHGTRVGLRRTRYGAAVRQRYCHPSRETLNTSCPFLPCCHHHQWLLQQQSLAHRPRHPSPPLSLLLQRSNHTRSILEVRLLLFLSDYTSRPSRCCCDDSRIHHSVSPTTTIRTTALHCVVLARWISQK